MGEGSHRSHPHVKGDCTKVWIPAGRDYRGSHWSLWPTGNSFPNQLNLCSVIFSRVINHPNWSRNILAEALQVPHNRQLFNSRKIGIKLTLNISWNLFNLSLTNIRDKKENKKDFIQRWSNCSLMSPLKVTDLKQMWSDASASSHHSTTEQTRAQFAQFCIFWCVRSALHDQWLMSLQFDLT
jgi:hypothetical protein